MGIWKCLPLFYYLSADRQERCQKAKIFNFLIGEEDPIRSFYKDTGAKNTAVELTISQRELAKILGATPEALSRALRKMANDGILSTAGRVITILDHEALQNLAEGE